MQGILAGSDVHVLSFACQLQLIPIISQISTFLVSAKTAILTKD
jgi:hypothetical protein